MPPTRSALALLEAAVVLTLSLPSFVMTLPASAASEPLYVALDEWAEVAVASGSPKPASGDEKQRVPKTPRGEKERAGDEKKNDDDKDDKDDDNDVVGCCYGDTGEDGGTSGSSMMRPPEVLWAEGSRAVVMPADTSRYWALVWSDPGGEAVGAELVIDLPEDSDIVVHDLRVVQDELWLYVSVPGAPVPLGWMRVEDLEAQRPMLSPRPPPPSGIALDVSWFYMGPAAVSEEYGGGWRIALQAFKRVGRVGQAVLSAGYSGAGGDPKFNYVTPTQIDYPQNSLLQIVDLGLSAGVDLRLGTKSDLRIAIGPTLCWVHESANMNYDSLQGGVVVASGHRDESLQEWRGGGQFNMNLGLRLETGYRIGLLIRAFAISWESESQKSLTLDYIGTQPLVGGGIGISLGQ